MGDNPVYPWTAGSWIYNMSGYKNWVPTGVNDTVNPFGRRLEEGGQPRRALQLDPYHVTGHR